MTQPTRIGSMTPVRPLGRSSERRHRRYLWLWRCDCGVEKILRSDQGAISCGCSRKGKGATHGLHGTRVYTIWASMLQRVLNPKCASFHKYGGRGITVCKRWRTFENFFADMGHPFSDEHSLERKNNNGPYTKSNCRWATPPEQSRNTRRNLFLTVDGRTQVLKDWATETGIPYKTIQSRFHREWTPEQVIGLSPRPTDRRLAANGVSRTVPEWAKVVGIKHSTLNFRLHEGWTVAQALNMEPPPTRKGKKGSTLTINGETKFLGEWAARSNLSVNLVWQRINKLKWSPEKALGF